MLHFILFLKRKICLLVPAIIFPLQFVKKFGGACPIFCHYWRGKEGRSTRHTPSHGGVADTASGPCNIYIMPGCVWVLPTSTYPCEWCHFLSHGYIYIYIAFSSSLMTGKDRHRSKSGSRCPHVWQKWPVTGNLLGSVASCDCVNIKIWPLWVTVPYFHTIMKFLRTLGDFDEVCGVKKRVENRSGT